MIKCKAKPTALKGKVDTDLNLDYLKEHLKTLEKKDLSLFSFFFFLSVPSDRMGEPTREGVRTAVLRLRRGHAGDDTLDTSRVFWVNRWMMRERRMMMTKLKRKKKTSNTRSRLGKEQEGNPQIVSM